MELTCGKEKKSFTFTTNDTPESREATIRHAFGLPEAIPIFVTKNEKVVSVMALKEESYDVSLGKEDRVSFITEPTHLVLRSMKKPEKIEISTVFTDVDFVYKYDEVDGLQLLCHFGVSWGISNNQGFDTTGSAFYISCLDARCALLKSENMTLLTRDHIPKDEWQTTSRTETRGWNIGAEFSIPANVVQSQSGLKLLGGYSSSQSHQTSATGMVATNHEFWPGKVQGGLEKIPKELKEDVDSDKEPTEEVDGKHVTRTTECTELEKRDFVHEHRWQVELRHLMNGELWSALKWKDIEIENIPLEAFGNKTKDFFISYRVLKEDNTEAKAYFVISARVLGRKTKSCPKKEKEFDFRQFIECYVTLDQHNKMKCKYKVWMYKEPNSRGILLTDTNGGQEERLSHCWLSDICE